ncbi:MAG: flagellar export protein FliJ [bacterium]|nr:flagellar export protein FliJ [bacterium]
MPFRFRFQRILEIREHKEEVLRGELSEAKRKLSQQEQVVSSLNEAHLNCLDELRQRKKTGIIPEEIRWYQRYLNKLLVEIASEEKKQENLSKEVDAARQRLVKASQDKRVMERLKDRALERYKEEEALKEQDFLDELGISIHYRRQE